MVPVVWPTSAPAATTDIATPVPITGYVGVPYATVSMRQPINSAIPAGKTTSRISCCCAGASVRPVMLARSSRKVSRGSKWAGRPRCCCSSENAPSVARRFRIESKPSANSGVGPANQRPQFVGFLGFVARRRKQPSAARCSSTSAAAARLDLQGVVFLEQLTAWAASSSLSVASGVEPETSSRPVLRPCAGNSVIIVITILAL